VYIISHQAGGRQKTRTHAAAATAKVSCSM